LTTNWVPLYVVLKTKGPKVVLNTVLSR